MRTLARTPQTLIWVLFLLICTSKACIKTSTYYRSQYRSQTHIFIPEEYRPMRPERSLEASGPLETQDFQSGVPTPRLVRVDGKNIQFASEEARWMTKGCRDRLLKLVTMVQNTWPNSDIRLRVLDGWIKPPPSVLLLSKAVTKREFVNPSSNMHKQTLKMSVPEVLAGYENSNQSQQPQHPRYQSGGSSGLGIKVTGPGGRVGIQRSSQPEVGDGHNKTGLESSRPRPYPIFAYRDHRQWDNSDSSVVEFDSTHRQLRQHPVMMEEFHYAGRAIDMILVDTKTGGPSRMSSVYPGKLAQLAYYGALFDWCYFARQGHVHCSVKPDSIITSQWFGCFPGSALARGLDGVSISLSSLRIGDRVMTFDAATHALVPTEVTAFLHRDEHQYSQWIEITYTLGGSNSSSKLRLTPNHLIYRWRGVSKSSVFADQVRMGDEIACIAGSSPSSLCRVERVQLVNSPLTETGIYAPLTKTGDMVIDGVYVSCYAHIREQWLAHLATMPLRLMSTFAESFPQTPGVNPYAGWLYWVAQLILPNQLLFSHS